MKYLSWDETGPRVLAWHRFVTRFADVNRDVLARARPLSKAIPLSSAMENTE
jgi:hypothetical protein